MHVEVRNFLKLYHKSATHLSFHTLQTDKIESLDKQHITCKSTEQVSNVYPFFPIKAMAKYMKSSMMSFYISFQGGLHIGH